MWQVKFVENSNNIAMQFISLLGFFSSSGTISDTKKLHIYLYEYSYSPNERQCSVGTM